MPRRKPEEILHRAVAEYLTAVLPRDVFFTTFPAGGGGRIRGAILRGCGLQPGVPDILIVCAGIAHWVELKAPKGVVSDEQTACHERLRAAGSNRIKVCRSIDDVAEALEFWGVPTRESRSAA